MSAQGRLTFAAPALPSSATVTRQRDQAIRQVATHAEDQRPSFVEDAAAFVLRYLEAHGRTSGEVLTMECKRAGIVPHDDRAFGAVYMRLSRRGLIVSAGVVRRARGHGTAGGNLWELTGGHSDQRPSAGVAEKARVRDAEPAE